jgi:hypothetical protein
LRKLWNTHKLAIEAATKCHIEWEEHLFSVLLGRAPRLHSYFGGPTEGGLGRANLMCWAFPFHGLAMISSHNPKKKGTTPIITCQLSFSALFQISQMEMLISHHFGTASAGHFYV